ncbi:uncharacterized protein LOC133529030 [Cydia pomonella]|uniref:uncharacterized protein LOC133529030 n=1 Tax=Cydia pomonella TaxID=82600 RepID=UPI002ADD8423|nr:uncharacterized protein LOC133529030 [Cydia pomonella]
MYEFEHLNPTRLIEEVKVRPALYKSDQPADREEKLTLWKQVGAALFQDWESYSKAMAYDRVLQLQKKWRSLRDAYNRELRARKTGVRINSRVYMHFKRMSFLGGFEGELSEEDEVEEDEPLPVKVKKPRAKKRKAKESSSENEGPAEEFEMPLPIFPPLETGEDSDKLFLLSFLPEMRQLPPKIKMWARARIARIMQEAVSNQYNEPGVSTHAESDIKLTRNESDE